MTENESPSDVRTIRKRLAGYFPAKSVEWKPQSVSGNRALAIAYIDARAVMKRLDDVLGVDGWEDHYDVLPDGCVVCTLRCRIAGAWVTKEDVGGESDQKDESDRRKASFSDALKRAAVKFGIGRYLYSLPSQWVAWDQQHKRFAETPRLPEWAIPKKEQTETPAPAVANPVPAQVTVSEAHVVELKALLERKGVLWRRVVEKEGLPPDWIPERLTCEQWGIITEKLKSNPDKPVRQTA